MQTRVAGATSQVKMLAKSTRDEISARPYSTGSRRQFQPREGDGLTTSSLIRSRMTTRTWRAPVIAPDTQRGVLSERVHVHSLVQRHGNGANGVRATAQVYPTGGSAITLHLVVNGHGASSRARKAQNERRSKRADEGPTHADRRMCTTTRRPVIRATPVGVIMCGGWTSKGGPAGMLALKLGFCGFKLDVGMKEEGDELAPVMP
ncbi:hypothetical protein FB451DRAFT_1179997 [Mycena latifolia]|nr:hypothetical protein FB451DRAFT_1179997 [Mycena latifolia]